MWTVICAEASLYPVEFCEGSTLLFKAEPSTCRFSCVLPRLFSKAILLFGRNEGLHDSGGSNRAVPVRGKKK